MIIGHFPVPALDWQKIELFTRKYVGSKTASGRYQSAAGLLRLKPTWDMLEIKESVTWNPEIAKLCMRVSR